jgi:putative FmdB family regulatory protein
MAKYDYKCNTCNDIIEIDHKHDEHIFRKCKVCGDELQRIYSPPGITFKGPGFYKSDTMKRPLD